MGEQRARRGTWRVQAGCPGRRSAKGRKKGEICGIELRGGDELYGSDKMLFLFGRIGAQHIHDGHPAAANPFANRNAKQTVWQPLSDIVFAARGER